MKVCYGLKEDYKRMMSLDPAMYSHWKENVRRETEAGIIVGVCMMLGVVLVVLALITY